MSLWLTLVAYGQIKLFFTAIVEKYDLTIQSKSLKWHGIVIVQQSLLLLHIFFIKYEHNENVVYEKKLNELFSELLSCTKNQLQTFSESKPGRT